MSAIIPALIISDDNHSNDFEELKSEFEKLRPFLGEFGGWMQIDITDGVFVPEKTVVNPEDLKYFTERGNVEFHLMISRPEETVGEWARLKPQRIIVHIEAVENMEEILDVCRENEVQIGLALNPETPNAMVEPWIGAVDTIVYLGVHPGRGGQKLIPEVLGKIRSLRRDIPDVKIEIDGGVNVSNIIELKNAGADYFVVGSGILKSSDIGAAIAELKNKIV